VNTPDALAIDRVGKKIINDSPPSWSDQQRRFLGAYRQNPVKLQAARLAGVSRAAVYLWMRDAVFVAAMQTEADAFYDAHRKKVLAQEGERQKWRDERERKRKPMRRYYLALARRQMPDGDWYPTDKEHQ
jgi:hypothetical protein